MLLMTEGHEVGRTRKAVKSVNKIERPSPQEQVNDVAATPASDTPAIASKSAPKSSRFSDLRGEELYNLFRESCINLGRGEPLIHMGKLLRSRGVGIDQKIESPIALFDLLVTQEKSLHFAHAPEETDSDEEISVAQPEDLRYDNIIQTPHPEKQLHRRLLNTGAFSNLCTKKQGTDALYLSLGSIQWTDENGQEMESPLVLVPVSLERKNVRTNFSLRWLVDNGVQTNIAIEKRFRDELGLSLPEMNIESSDDLIRYMNKVAHVVSEHGFRVNTQQMRIGFFFLGKFVLYNALSPEGRADGSNPLEHEIVSGLLESGLSQPRYQIRKHQRADDGSLEQQFLVGPADAPQMRIVQDAQANCTMYVEGPPGNGKTLTAVQVAAAIVAQGGKIIFFTKDDAAAVAFTEELEKRGLGDLVLNIHDDTIPTKKLIQRLATIKKAGAPEKSKRLEVVKDLESVRDELNHYCDFLHTPYFDTGLTPHQILTKLLCLRKEVTAQRLLEATPGTSWSSLDFARAVAVTTELEQELEILGVPNAHPFHGSNVTDYVAVRQRELQSLADRTHRNAEDYLKALSSSLGNGNLSANIPYAELTPTLAALNEIVTHKDILLDLKSVSIGSNLWEFSEELESKVLEDGALYREAHEQAKVIGDWNKSLTHVREVIEATGDSYFRVFNKEYRAAVATLESVYNGPIPRSAADKLAVIEDIERAQALRPKALESGARWSHLFGELWNRDAPENVNWEKLKGISAFMGNFRERYSELSQYSELKELTQDIENVANIAVDLEELIHKNADFQETLSVFFDQLSYTELSKEQFWNQAPLPQHVSYLSRARSNIESLTSLSRFNRLKEKCGDAQCEFVLQNILESESLPKDLTRSLEYSWYYNLAKQIWKDEETIRDFDVTQHQSRRNRFADLWEDFFKENAQAINRLSWELGPHAVVEGGQTGVLAHQTGISRGHLQRRQAFESAGDAWQAHCPIIVTSFESGARDLPPGSVEGRTVIVEEGGLATPAEGLLACPYGKNLIVFGDKKQLNPDRSFEKRIISPTGDLDASQQVDSLLDLLEAKGIPARTLEYHYRSKKMGLMYLPNLFVYEGKLRIPPSPFIGDEATGYEFTHVADALYDRGGKATNEKVAEQTLEVLINHAHTAPEESVGIVTTNLNQVELLRNKIEERRRTDRTLDRYLQLHPERPWFVRTWKEVQSNQRDKIIIDFPYGVDSQGRFPMSFGDANKKEIGKKLLNVAITRAREGIHLVSGIKASDLRVDSKSSDELKFLRAIFEYAETGRISLPEKFIPKPLSAFEDYVRHELEARGYSVETNIGTSDWRVPLAVYDTEADGKRFLLGLLSDDEDYARTGSAFDREVAEERTLNNIGWETTRLWMGEWAADPDAALERLVAKIELEKRKRTYWTQNSDPAPTTSDTIVIERHSATESVPIGLKLEPYRRANVTCSDNVDPDADDPFEHVHYDTVRWAINTIIEEEGPIHEDLLQKRLRETFGNLPIDKDLQVKIDIAKMHPQLIEREGDYWYHNSHRSSAKTTVRRRGNLHRDEGKLFEYVPAAELENSILLAAKNAVGISKEHLIKAACHNLGFRQTAKRKEVVGRSIDSLLVNERLEHRKNMIFYARPQNEVLALMNQC